MCGAESGRKQFIREIFPFVDAYICGSAKCLSAARSRFLRNNPDYDLEAWGGSSRPVSSNSRSYSISSRSIASNELPKPAKGVVFDEPPELAERMGQDRGPGFEPSGSDQRSLFD